MGCQAENELAFGFPLWKSGPGGGVGGAWGRGARGGGPLDPEGYVVEEAFGVPEERPPRRGGPDLEPVEHADDHDFLREARALAKRRGEENAPLHVEIAVRRAAGEEARQGFHRPAEGGQRSELRLEPRPLGGRVGGQALVEERHHERRHALLREGATEGGGNGKAAFHVDFVAISPFEHRRLGVFHTFFHFSTLRGLVRIGGSERDGCGERSAAQAFVAFVAVLACMPFWMSISVNASMMRTSHHPARASSCITSSASSWVIAAR
jgi:hypothetical protein